MELPTLPPISIETPDDFNPELKLPTLPFTIESLMAAFLERITLGDEYHACSPGCVFHNPARGDCHC
jgi:hypothetical protein